MAIFASLLSSLKFWPEAYRWQHSRVHLAAGAESLKTGGARWGARRVSSYSFTYSRGAAWANHAHLRGIAWWRRRELKAAGQTCIEGRWCTLTTYRRKGTNEVSVEGGQGDLR